MGSAWWSLVALVMLALFGAGIWSANPDLFGWAVGVGIVGMGLAFALEVVQAAWAAVQRVRGVKPS
ncbi:MAG: hypothetical protein ACREKB_19195 [Candidatus Rokuibacteriota bacterium]